MRLKRGWLRRTALALVVGVVLLYGGVSWYLAYQVTLAERKPLEAAPGEFGLVYGEVAFASRDGEIDLKGWLIPTTESNPGATIIITHGINSNRADTDIGLLEIARDLGQRGFNVLLFDLRGHGESGGTKVSGGYFERQDVLGAFDYLVEDGTPPDRIGLMGFSLGAAIVLLAAGEEPGVRAVVADSPFADVADMVVEEVKRRTDAPAWLVPALVPGLTMAARLIYGIDMGAMVPARVAAGLDYPLLLIHGTGDERIGPSHSQRIKEASASPDTELWLLEGVEHVLSYRERPEEYIERVAAYFVERLG